jgi:hypothetical protein
LLVGREEVGCQLLAFFYFLFSIFYIDVLANCKKKRGKVVKYTLGKKKSQFLCPNDEFNPQIKQ